MDTKNHALEALVCIVVLCILLYFIIPVIVSHWVVIVTGGLIVLGFATCHKTIPLGWQGVRAISDLLHDREVRKVDLMLMDAVVARIEQGHDTEYSNAITGVAFKLSLPRRDVTIEEEEDDEEEQLQIEAPRLDDEYLNISEDYQPHADEFLSARKLVVGVSGSGKSNTVGTLCEELGRFNVPMVLADTEDEYQPLGDKRWLPSGMLVDSRKINPDNAAQFGHYLLENNIQAILNLQSFEMEEGAWVLVNLIQGLREWQEERANEIRIPCEFLLEEATTWLPQNVKESPLNDSEVMARLQSAFFNDLVRKGRKRGLGLTVICQKIAEIDKRALQCDVKLLHRQTELNDLQKYAKMGITNEETLSLQQGEGYFFSSRVNKTLIQVRKRYSDHGANTPGLSELRAHQRVRNTGEKVLSFEPSDRQFEMRSNGLMGLPDLISSDRSMQFDHTASTVQKRVPETTKTAILDLYRNGTKRKDIQGVLGLNGDEYWMIKVVCDEDDRLKEGL